MKRLIPPILTIFALAPALLAAPPDAKISARTYIPASLQVPAFTPPAPVERQPLPVIRIDSSVTVPSTSGTTLTLQRGAASTLPDLPLPPPPVPETPARKLTAEQLARLAYHRRHTLNLGATVYDHKVSVVHWTDQETSTFYQAVCGFDIGLLAGTGGFVHDGENYSLFLLHSDLDTAIRRSVRNYLPRVPDVAPGQILITQGDPKAPYATAPLHLIRELLEAEKERLTQFQAARKRYQLEAAAWEKANPPVPHDETFIFRPHRGSRYLTNPQPEKSEGAR